MYMFNDFSFDNEKQMNWFTGFNKNKIYKNGINEMQFIAL